MQGTFQVYQIGEDRAGCQVGVKKQIKVERTHTGPADVFKFVLTGSCMRQG